MKKFNVLTARKRVARVRSWLKILGLGYSLFECEGGWPASPKRYVAEKSMEIRILARGKDKEKIKLLCHAIKALNNQEEVLVDVEKASEPWRI